MADISIRKVDSAAVKKIDDIAKSKGKSRESYLRELIEEIAINGEIKNTENKYANLVEKIADIIKMNTDKMEENNQLIEELIRKL